MQRSIITVLAWMSLLSMGSQVPTVGGSRELKAAPPSLDGMVSKAELIVVGRVEAVHRRRQSPPRVRGDVWPDDKIVIVELSVGARAMGPAGLQTLFVAKRIEREDTERLTRVGQSSLLFLKPQVTTSGSWNAGTLARMEERFGLGTIFEVLEEGALAVSRSGAVESWPGQWQAEPTAANSELATATAVGIIRERVHRLTPRLEFRSITSGALHWTVSVDASGAWTESDGHQVLRGHLDAAARGKIWSAARKAPSTSWPKTLAHSRHPDDTSWILEWRTAEGVQSTRVFPLSELVPPEPAHWRGFFEQLWADLPGERRPETLFH